MKNNLSCFFLKCWYLSIMLFAGSESHVFFTTTVLHHLLNKNLERDSSGHKSHTHFQGHPAPCFSKPQLISAVAALRVGDLQPSTLHGSNSERRQHYDEHLFSTNSRLVDLGESSLLLYLFYWLHRIHWKGLCQRVSVSSLCRCL